MPPFTNANAVGELYGGSAKQFARAHGNVQSRVDFACYRCNLPPLGLTADEGFRQAWQTQGRSWGYPVPKMQAAAQAHVWTEEDFARITEALERVPKKATKAWSEEARLNELGLRVWAQSFLSTRATARVPQAPAKLIRIDWMRDELILALDLYLEDSARAWDDKDELVIEMSQLLNRLGLALGLKGGATFRNSNGVAMKLMNFRGIDPAHVALGRAGLKKGSKADVAVWKEFAGDRVRLRQLADELRRFVDLGSTDTTIAGDDEEGIAEAPEGKVFTRVHRVRERDPRLVKECKRRALKEHGRIFCAACTFDFGRKYGDDVGHIIDCHHTNPVHTLDPGHKTKVEDLVLLCPNCHRVVHASKQWLTFSQLQAKVRPG